MRHPIALRGVVLLSISYLFSPLSAQGQSFREQYDAIVREFDQAVGRQERNATTAKRAKERRDNQLNECYERILELRRATLLEEDLIVAITIAEQLSKPSEVIDLCEYLQSRNPASELAVYAKLRALLGMGRLNDAEEHVHRALNGANERSDYFSMCGALMSAYEGRGQWAKGVEHGAKFLKWCGREIRDSGKPEVSVEFFLGVFDHCSEEASDVETRDQVIRCLSDDVLAAMTVKLKDKVTNRDELMKVERLFRLQHELCCLSERDDPAACVVKWLGFLTDLTHESTSKLALEEAIAEAAGAAVASLCLTEDLDRVQEAADQIRTAWLSTASHSDGVQRQSRAVNSLSQLQEMIKAERALRQCAGNPLDLMDGVDWFRERVFAEDTKGKGPLVVYVWSPRGRNPGQVLQQRLSQIRKVLPVPLVILSPYSDGSGEDAPKRRQDEGGAIRRYASSVSEEIAVACVDEKVLSVKLAAKVFPQIYVFDSAGKVQLAIAGLDKWRLRKLRDVLAEFD